MKQPIYSRCGEVATILIITSLIIISLSIGYLSVLLNKNKQISKTAAQNTYGISCTQCTGPGDTCEYHPELDKRHNSGNPGCDDTGCTKDGINGTPQCAGDIKVNKSSQQVPNCTSCEGKKCVYHPLLDPRSGQAPPGISQCLDKGCREGDGTCDPSLPNCAQNGASCDGIKCCNEGTASSCNSSKICEPIAVPNCPAEGFGSLAECEAKYGGRSCAQASFSGGYINNCWIAQEKVAGDCRKGSEQVLIYLCSDGYYHMDSCFTDNKFLTFKIACDGKTLNLVDCQLHCKKTTKCLTELGETGDVGLAKTAYYDCQSGYESCNNKIENKTFYQAQCGAPMEKVQPTPDISFRKAFCRLGFQDSDCDKCGLSASSGIRLDWSNGNNSGCLDFCKNHPGDAAGLCPNKLTTSSCEISRTITARSIFCKKAGCNSSYCRYGICSISNFMVLTKCSDTPL